MRNTFFISISLLNANWCHVPFSHLLAHQLAQTAFPAGLITVDDFNRCLLSFSPTARFLTQKQCVINCCNAERGRQRSGRNSDLIEQWQLLCPRASNHSRTLSSNAFKCLITFHILQGRIGNTSPAHGSPSSSKLLHYSKTERVGRRNSFDNAWHIINARTEVDAKRRRRRCWKWRAYAVLEWRRLCKFDITKST